MKFLYQALCSCGRKLRTKAGAKRHDEACSGTIEGQAAVREGSDDE